MSTAIATFTFNPPCVTLVGKGLSTTAMNRLESELVVRTSTSRPVTTGAEGPAFVQAPNSGTGVEAWRLEIPNHFCDDLAKCAFYDTAINVMEGDGWSLVSTSAVTSKDDKDITRFFFSRRR